MTVSTVGVGATHWLGTRVATAWGDTGTDTFLLTGDGDKVDGEAPKSTDWVDYGLAAAAAHVDLELGTGTVDVQSSTDHIAGVRSMFGSPFGDTLRGDSGQTVAIGNGGNDFIEGRDGGDSLRGGTGDDTLDGGPGFDNLDGALGIDTCINGEGFARCDVISPRDGNHVGALTRTASGGS